MERRIPKETGEISSLEGLTVESLLGALKEFIEEDLKDYRLPVKQEGWKDQPVERPVEVSEFILQEAEDGHERIPYIVLQPLNGKDDEDENGRPVALANIRIVITIFNKDKLEGRRQMMHIIERLRRDLIRKTIIGKTFALKKPLEWLMYPDDIELYHMGEISTTWQIPEEERYLPELRW